MKTRKKGNTVIAQMIKNVQVILREMWYNRNDELHNNEQSRLNKTKSKELDLLIDGVLTRKKDIPVRHLAQADRKYFRRTRQYLKTLRNTRKERWINDAEAILDKYDNENNSEQVRAFRAYFMHRDDG